MSQALTLGTGVTHLDLSDSHLWAVPQQISSLDNLITLEADRNYLTRLPTEIGSLRRLETLDAKRNRIRDIPTSIANLDRLAILNLSRNELEDLPVEIGFLTELRTLDLYHNRLQRVPWSIGQLVTLDSLDLGRNPLQELPPEIGNLSNLKLLRLSETQLRTLPPEIGRLRSLAVLYVHASRLENLPAEIGNLQNLQALYVGRGDGKSRVLRRNALRELPRTVGNLTNLRVLAADDNEIDSLPSTVGNLQHLQELYVGGNRLKSLPAEIGELRNLRLLQLQRNQLEELPAEIGNLSNLAYLDISQNRLRTLPDEMGKLTNLRQLYVQENSLRRIPRSVLSLPHLQILDSEGNPIPLSRWEESPDTLGRTLVLVSRIGSGVVGLVFLLVACFITYEHEQRSLQARATVLAGAWRDGASLRAGDRLHHWQNAAAALTGGLDRLFAKSFGWQQMLQLGCLGLASVKLLDGITIILSGDVECEMGSGMAFHCGSAAIFSFVVGGLALPLALLRSSLPVRLWISLAASLLLVFLAASSGGYLLLLPADAKLAFDRDVITLLSLMAAITPVSLALGWALNRALLMLVERMATRVHSNPGWPALLSAGGVGLALALCVAAMVKMGISTADGGWTMKTAAAAIVVYSLATSMLAVTSIILLGTAALLDCVYWAFFPARARVLHAAVIRFNILEHPKTPAMIGLALLTFASPFFLELIRSLFT